MKRASCAVILDFEMPHMDGAEVARRIRKEHRPLPVLLLSGFPEAVPGVALALVDAFIQKGDAPDRFLSFVAALVNQRSGHIILNVDDHDAHRYAITRVLKHAGFDVVEAGTGREALSLARCRPSLVLLDLNLPDLLGFEVCKQLRANRATRNIPIIHISATFDSDVAKEESRASGANTFIRYPSDPRQILQIVHVELKKRNEELLGPQSSH